MRALFWLLPLIPAIGFYFFNQQLWFFKSTPTVTVTLYPNGEVTDGLQVTLSSSQFNATRSFAEAIGDFKLAPLHGTPGGVVPGKIYNQVGQEISSFYQLQNGDELFLCAPGIQFVWPFRYFGHKVELKVSHFEGSSPHSLVLEAVSHSPRVFSIKHFLSLTEADDIIERAKGQLARSGVGLNTGETSYQRTSENTFDNTSPTAITLLKRAFRLLGLDRNTELEDGLQVLRYEPKQAYIAHTDWFTPESFPHVGDGFVPGKGGANRYATVFLYLNNVPLGGQTAFPQAPPLPSQNTAMPPNSLEILGVDTWEYNQSKECYEHLAFSPSQGDAVLFYSQKGDGELDSASLHSGCPVIEGVKWGANLWVWNGPRPANMVNGIGFQFQNDFPFTVDVVYAQQSVLATLEANQLITFNSYDGHQWSARRPGSTEDLWEHTTRRADAGTVVHISDGVTVPPPPPEITGALPEMPGDVGSPETA